MEPGVGLGPPTRRWRATRNLASAEHLDAHRAELLTNNAEALFTDLITENDAYLGYLVLLGPARHLGVEEAHRLVVEPDGDLAPLRAALLTSPS